MTTLDSLKALENWLSNQIIGQSALVQRLLIAIIADGHLLVEGAPGLAKTRAIKCLSEGIEGDFQRIQFTPDLLPSDVTGTDIFRPETASFEFQSGPIFHNLVLADEINRAPAKVQSALLEAMGERQVSIGKTTYPLPDLFLVMATQNPLEQEGTYPLPEAQLDRFLMHVRVDFPNLESERLILQQSRSEASSRNKGTAPTEIPQTTIFAARDEALSLHMADSVEEFIVRLADATRQPQNYAPELANMIDYGVSPRATISLDRCARAHALLQGRDYVTPDDVFATVHDVFRHRLILSFEAEASGVTPDDIVDTLIRSVPIA